jgi:hypothetical protein
MVPSHAELLAMYLIRLVLDVPPTGGGNEWQSLDGLPKFGPKFFSQLDTGSSEGL